MKNIDSVIVSIDMAGNNPTFHKMSATKKIEYLKEKIEQIHTAFMKKHSGCRLIVIWPEYGIYNYDELTICKTISKKDDELLKKTMMDLTKKYDNLYIIGGVAVDDEVTGENPVAKKLEEILDFCIVNMELINELKLDISTKPYSDREIGQLKECMPSSLVFTSNECRVYNKGLESSHGKLYSTVLEMGSQTARRGRTSDNMGGTHYRLQPGGKDSFSPLMKIDGLQFGVEICLEHESKLLSSMVEERKLDRPLFQFVISDSCKLLIQNNCASYGLIKNCKASGTQFILSRHNENPKKSVPVYLIAADEEKVSLDHAIPAVYPFQYKILDRIEKELKSKESSTLQFFKSRFEDQFCTLKIFNKDCLELLTLFEEIKAEHSTLHKDLFLILDTESAKKQFCFNKFLDDLKETFFKNLSTIVARTTSKKEALTSYQGTAHSRLKAPSRKTDTPTCSLSCPIL